MKQIIQDLKNGRTILEEVPAPVVKKGSVLVKTQKTLVSLGTERMLVEFGKANLIAKARKQPDKVKMVLDKIKTDGLRPTLEAVFSKLNQPLPLGYCNAGEIIAVGEGVVDLKTGDRVASNGHHAEYVCIPQNLAAKIPDNVSYSEASFTVIGAVGLQGIRLLNPTFGETIVVVGLGLIGLVAAQLLKANGCRVIGFDFDESKVSLATEKGITAVCLTQGGDAVKIVEEKTGRTGADGVIITASAKSNAIISDAAKMSRKRGRIVLVGVVGLDISRADFYEKELTFQVSCSYGPGRYDDDYEQKGLDYPLPFVRWTEKRNFEAVLQAISNGNLDVSALITKEVKLRQYHRVYDQMDQSASIACLLDFTDSTPYASGISLNKKAYKSTGSIGVIGAGNFARAVILPSLKAHRADVGYVASAGGLSAKMLAKKHGIPKVTTDYKYLLEDDNVSLVVISTRHDQHANMTIDALKAGKHVFVEKPLALTLEELERINKEVLDSRCSVVVGFNRRFSPHAEKTKAIIGSDNIPLSISATMNAGFIPAGSWLHDPKVGGGRIIGEACHYFDMMIYLTGSEIKSVCMNALGTDPKTSTDNASILLKFRNGSTGVVNYFANGAKSYPKERIEVFSQGRTIVIDNFRLTRGYGTRGFSSIKTRQDKGHGEQFRRLVNFAKQGGQPLIPYHEIHNASKAVLLAIESIKTGQWVSVE